MLDLKDLQEEEAESFEIHKLPAYQDTHIPYIYVYIHILMNTYDYLYTCTCIKFKILQKATENKL